MSNPEMEKLNRKLKNRMLIVLLVVALEFLGIINIPWWLIVYPLIGIVNMVIGVILFIWIILRWL
jgi:hypothetical protein